VVELALRVLGAENTQLYDGSWQEYGAKEEPDFLHGNKHGWDEPVNESFDRIMSQRNPEKYRIYLQDKK